MTISSEKMSELGIRLDHINAFWRAANYLSAAQLYLKSNPLLRKPLTKEDIKPRLLGHFGTVPGITFIYAHLNRLILETDANVLLITGPGHGAPANLSCLFLEGTLEEYEDDLTFDLYGIENLVKKFSWPFGHPSHLVPQIPGQIQEGGELGYCLSHAYGAAFDNPDLIVTCIVGDGEAETGPLAASWHCNKFLNPATSGAVLPILHLNGYKISGPTLFSRMSKEELLSLFEGYGYQVTFVHGDDPMETHEKMWETLDWAYQEIKKIQTECRNGNFPERIHFPMIILETKKGWTAPKMIDGKPVEGSFRSHQIPVSDPKENPEHLKILEDWLKSYHPENLFDESGKPLPFVTQCCPKGNKRMGKNPHANGGNFLKPLHLPNFKDYALEIKGPTLEDGKATETLAKYLRDVFRMNGQEENFRFFCPDETTSNKMTPIFEATKRAWMWPIKETDENLSKDGRVVEILSEHICEGLLEGYLLTGRHGLFASYEAFIPIVDSMLNQFAKWLKVSKETSWRKPISSLNYLLTSHVWRQDHNGYTHQVPSFINNVVNKKGSVARVYLPPDANCLLSVADHCLKSRDYVNLIVASKQKMPQYLDIESAIKHAERGVSIWDFASHGEKNPDIILACAGDVPTLETVAASWILKQHLPEINVRVVNVIDLLVLISYRDHPHGLDHEEFLHLFTNDTPVIFAFHGYPRLIHELVYHRPNPERFHVHGYMEEGTTTTPFDMLVRNQMSRFHLVKAALKRVQRLRSEASLLTEEMNKKLEIHHDYIKKHGKDMSEILDWRWS